jgi:hypothetical protein
MLETISAYLPVAQFMLVFIAIPLIKLLFNQNKQIAALQQIAQNQQDTVTFIQGILLDTASPDIITKHLIAQKKRKDGVHP